MPHFILIENSLFPNSVSCFFIEFPPKPPLQINQNKKKKNLKNNKNP